MGGNSEAPIYSQMDTSKPLTPSLWAVTLIIPQSTNPTHHAQIFVEGNNGDYFAKVIDLKGIKLKDNGYDCAEDCHFLYSDKGRVVVYNLTPGKIWRVKIKSDTFMRAAIKVQRLIDESVKEAAQYENKEFTNPTPFNHLGSRSQLIGNNVNYQITDPRLRELYDNNQRNFHYIREVASNPGIVNRTCAAFVAIAAATFPLFGMPAFLYYYLRTGISLLSSRGVRPDEDAQGNGIDPSTHSLVQSARTNIIERSVRPNSCMTWTRDKLLIVDIVVTDIFWDNIISVTDDHIRNLQNVGNS
jgi:hypothetical protein